jgi:hypothetical protein
MAFLPYLSEAGFESGAADPGNVLTDTTSKSRYMHYTGTVPEYGFTPWRGAYCLVIDLARDATGAEAFSTLAAFDHTDGQYWALGFALYLKGNVMTEGDRTSLLKIVSAAATEVCLQLYYTAAGGLQFLLTQAEDTAVGTNPVVAISENKWHWIEMYGFKDNGGANDGTAYVIIDGEAAISITGKNQGNFTDVYYGVDDIDAGHTAGVIAFDDFIAGGAHTAAIYVGGRSRYTMNPHISAIASNAGGYHLFLGPGTVNGAELLTTKVNDTLRLYDTDTGSTTGTYNGTLVAETACLEIDATTDIGSIPHTITGPLVFERGCFALLTPAGAAGARAIVHIDPNPASGLPAPVYYGNEANLKHYAIHRTRRGGNR